MNIGEGIIEAIKFIINTIIELMKKINNIPLFTNNEEIINELIKRKNLFGTIIGIGMLLLLIKENKKNLHK